MRFAWLGWRGPGTGEFPAGASRGSIDGTTGIPVYLCPTVNHYGWESTRMEHVSEAVVVHVPGSDVDEELARTVRLFIAEVSKPEEPRSADRDMVWEKHHT
jgi:hypothetical protein